MIAQQTNSVVVNNPPRISSGPLPPMYVGEPFTHTFTHADGVEPFGQWLVVSGATPAGLTLDTATGVLSGTPTTAGPYNFTIGIPDATG